MTELMSPAGNLSSLVAAIDGGADSVYLGLDKFNARRPAQNFAPFIMKKVVTYAHKHNCKVYVTLNIDMKPAELQEVSQMLTFLENVGADAVIVKDFAIIDLINKFFPNLELHFSTQCVVSNSLEVEFAVSQNAKRVVLARELTLDEIKACVDVAHSHNAEIEIFTEGSMCFCISGRCLMSSFIGGRSGNRGACTGCCRVKWGESNGQTSATFSMKDLSLASRLDQIVSAGVDALKIEGRLKKSGWVSAITKIYRNILDKTGDIDVNVLRQYTARQVGTGHLFGHDDIVGDNENWQNYTKTVDDIPIDPFFDDVVAITIKVWSQIECRAEYRGQVEILAENIPKLPKKAKIVRFNLIKDRISENLAEFNSNIEILGDNIDCGLSFINTFSEKIAKTVEKIKNQTDKYPTISHEIQEYIKQIPTARSRKRLLGNIPNKIIVRESQLAGLKNYREIEKIVVYLEPESVVHNDKQVATFCKTHNLTVALPEMIYEHELDYYARRVETLCESGIASWEANSLSGIKLLDGKNVEKHAGVGLSVMNHKAAEYLNRLGFCSCYISCEGDISVYKAMSSFVPENVELNAVVFSKIPLFISRVAKNHFANKTFRDKYIELTANPVGDVNYFTPNKIFCLVDAKSCKNLISKDKIYFDNLVCDLRFFADFRPFEAMLIGKNVDNIDTFNYRRKLI